LILVLFPSLLFYSFPSLLIIQHRFHPPFPPP
jgi:hypothetical protein